MQKDTIVKILSILEFQKLPKVILIKLENHPFPNWEQQKTHLAQPKTSWKTEELKKKCQVFFKKCLR